MKALTEEGIQQIFQEEYGNEAELIPWQKQGECVTAGNRKLESSRKAMYNDLIGQARYDAMAEAI